MLPIFTMRVCFPLEEVYRNTIWVEQMHKTSNAHDAAFARLPCFSAARKEIELVGVGTEKILSSQFISACAGENSGKVKFEYRADY
jgi:hypothetical protein